MGWLPFVSERFRGQTLHSIAFGGSNGLEIFFKLWIAEEQQWWDLTPAYTFVSMDTRYGMRNPFVVTLNRNAATTTAAPPAGPVDCEGAWSGCPVTCGSGSQTYSVTTAKVGTGNECEATAGDTRDYPGLPVCPVDCEG